MKRATKEEPKMWGMAIIGFRNRLLKYESGRELDWMIVGSSPRKANLTLYVLDGSPRQTELLEKLGKHTTGKGCLYIKRRSHIDEQVLESLVGDSVKQIKKSNR